MGGIVGRPLRGRTRRALVYVALLAACRSDATGPGVARLVFSAQPSSVTAGITIAPPIEVAALDANGNTVTEFTGGVTIVIGTNPSGGALSGTTSVAAIAGVATFPNLSIDKSGAGYTFHATSGGLTSSLSAAITVTPAVATQLAFTVQPSNAEAGAAIAPAVQVTARDAFGNPATGFGGPVSLAIGTNPSGGTLSGATSQSATAGVAGFGSLSIDKVGAGYTLTAISGTLTAATSTGFTIIVGSVSPSQSTAIASVGSITAGSSASTITVTAKDAIGNPIPGASVVLSATGTGNTLSQPAVTDGNGATSGTLSSTVAEPKTVSAVVNGVGLSQTATVNVTPASANGLVFSEQPSTVGAGVTITPPVQVTALDQFGNIATSYTGLVTVALGSNPAGGNLSGTTALAAAAGVASYGDLSIDKAGAGYTLTASGVGLGAGTSDAFTITVGGVSGSQSTVSAVPANITASNGSSSSTITVIARDAFGNPIPGATAVLSATGSGNILTQPVGTTNASGVATGTLSSTSAESKTVSATIDGVGITQMAVVLVSPAAASALIYTSQPSTTGAGTTITPAVEVTAVDQFGNTATGFAADVIVAIGTNPSGGTLTGTTSRSAVSGVASFNDLSIDKAGSGYTLSATSASLNQTSASFDVSAGGPDHLAISVPPSNTTAGATITPSIQVEIRDQYDNLVSGATPSVTLALAANPGGGTLSGTVTRAAVAGVAAFTNLSIDRAGIGYTMRASASGLIPDTSAAFDITPGVAAQLAFVVQPSNATAGATITPALQVEIEDVLGNRVTTATNTITLAILANPGGGTLSGTVAVSAAGGVASFSTLTIDKAGTGYTVQATAGGLTAAASLSFDVTAGAAHHLAFSVQPSNTVAVAAITPAVRVEVQDQSDNLVTGATTSITVAIAINPGGGSLSGTDTRAAVAGVATFSGLSIDKAGVGYTLGATASGLVGDTSSSFNITVGAAVRLAFFVQPTNATGGATIAPPVQVEIRDAGGNRVTSATNTVTLTIGTNAGGGTLSGGGDVAAGAGVATFTGLSIDRAGAGYTLNAGSSGLTGATSSSFDIAVGPAAQLGFLVQPTTAVAGATIIPPVQVEIQDLGGNRVSGATNSVTLAIGANPSGGVLSGGGAVPATGGVGTFSNLSIDQAGTAYTLVATSGALSAAPSTAFDITPAPDHLAFFVQPASATAGMSITPSIQVEIQDAANNRVANATNSITLAIANNPGGGTLSGTATRDAVAGVATFSGLSINKTGTGYTLWATSGSLTSATSAGFDITAAAVDAVQSGLVASDDTMGQCLSSCLTTRNGAVTITVTARDQFGNVVPSAAVTLTASPASTDSNRFTNPGTSGITDASGVFTANFNSAQALLNKTIAATAGGTPVSQSATVAVMPVLVGAGDIADCARASDDSTARLLDSIPGTVFTLGDNAYPNGRTQDYANCYDPTWGRHKARTRPVTGNHEYDSSSTAAPYLAYFGAAIADPLNNGGFYYSYDLGAWHIVVLNTDIPIAPQVAWLQTDLAGRTNQCVLALWHRAIFTSGSSGGRPSARPLWQALQDVGAEIVINGHDHLYERFALQDSLGNADPTGIREFIVGTGGGETHTNYVLTPPNVEASDNGNFSRGVIRLTLYPNSYRWEFIPAAGFGTFTDSGTAACH